MEQRIGPSSQPLDGAGIDPAFIPGLTAPASAGQGDPAEPEDAVTATDTAAAEAVDKAGPRDVGAEPDGPSALSDPSDPESPADSGELTGVGESGASEGETAEDETSAGEDAARAEAPEGPVFEAADRRARIVADHSGVRLSLDDQECEFHWDEIGAVETETARFGKRFTVTVHTPDRRWYPIEIEAAARSDFPEWEARLDAVLDAYFEDGDEEAAAVVADGEKESAAPAKSEDED
ncbi:hypothetical protein ACIQ6V_09900 [Streptomyces sp. NPDC096198]|uniref:hypothetical protein n=1 Tax=Streptomyces sp. NPDC096198 TaxID=3366080 RepID=UPI0037FE26BD